MSCTSLEDVENLEASNSQTIRPRNFIPVPPFLVKILSDSIAANKANTSKVFLDVITAIKDFDEIYDDDDEFKEKASTKCKLLLHWLYVASRDDDANGIAQIQFATCTNKSLLAKLRNFMTVNLTVPATISLKPCHRR